MIPPSSPLSDIGYPRQPQGPPKVDVPLSARLSIEVGNL